VGGGTGMICNEFKGGIGTASRVLDSKYGGYAVGVLVQCNYGQRDQLRIAGVPVGREIPGQKVWDDHVGSIIVVAATDARSVIRNLQDQKPISRALQAARASWLTKFASGPQRYLFQFHCSTLGDFRMIDRC
jgi:L-aminopeptidase/D-esterase-like protein